ncbi:MAG TPA: phosphoenolpyruvate carboxylase [Vicinamibacterales bacterium]
MGLDPHQPLRDDVRMLGEVLGRVLRHHEGDEIFERVEQVREAAKRARTFDSELEHIDRLLRDMPIASALTVARAFAHFLTLANIAEQHHRVHRRRDHARNPHGQPQRGSAAETLARLRQAGVHADTLAAAIGSMRVELVFTAHPTEIVRRTLLQKHNRIAQILAFRDRPDLTPDEQEESLADLQREIAAAWQTDEVRRARVTPLDEVRAGLVVFEQSLWDALPQYLRAVDRALTATCGTGLPRDVAPVRFGSWIGGDRDGNPSITPEVTRQATWLARWQAADLYHKEIIALRSELSLSASHASDELRARVGSAHEPYRALLAVVRDRLAATRDLAEEALAESAPKLTGTAPYLSASELAEPLELCFRSLVSTGNEVMAAGRLTDILRRVTTFGVTLARLDLRQEAERHTAAVDWIAQAAGLGRYAVLSEPERQRLLVQHLAAGDVRFDDLPTPDAEVRDVLDTFRVAARIHPESLGAYVITMASAPSDVLAVEFLQMAAGTSHPQRVVPLFETARDLEHAGAIMSDLLAIPWYRDRIKEHQEVMIGYSDSAKDAGRMSADWALYCAQEEVVAACEKSGVRLTLFHGRGGSIGRGGGPTYLAIQSQPPGSIRGTLRATEQGEMMQAKFGLVDIAIRTLEVYTTATLEAAVAPQPSPKPEWRACMDQVSGRARATYRSVVYDDPRFIPYFRTATPEPELTQVSIGSRPARRTPGKGVESLRAIPWQFAWTQTRLMLPSWLGIEDALSDGHNGMLREMYSRWAFFASTIDLVEMTLAKADSGIAAQYDWLAPEELRPLGLDLRHRLARAVDAVLAVTGHDVLLEANPVLRRSIDVRNPYVDPINLVQVELLRRLRGTDPDPELFDAFVVTVNGIAAGMRNTG